MRTDAEYADMSRLRSESSDKVLDSSSSKKIVMAGPGTGKSYLFQQVAKRYISEGRDNILVLSFINELVKDRTVAMHGLAEVSTLHSYAAKKLKQSSPMYMGLLKVIDTDIKLIEGEEKDLAGILHTLKLSERKAIEFMRDRRKYYDYLDPSSIIFELLHYFRAHPEKIPAYDLILVDEYQDFNLMEVELINQLAINSDILVAGDDDQSLYSFKHSIPENIRDLYKGGVYERFELPYCSRSTEVIIDAFCDSVESAKSAGHLSGRVDKQYLYFPTPEKDKLSLMYPKIDVRLNTQQLQCAFYIDQEISTVFQKEPDFDVLIICSMNNQINKLGSLLRKKGYRNISGDDSNNKSNEQLVDGLGILSANINSNLGWRLCAQVLLDQDKFEECVSQTKDNSTQLKDLIPVDEAQYIKKLARICKKVKEGTGLSDEDRDTIFSGLNIDTQKLGEREVREQIFNRSSNKVQHDIRIKITTIRGSKGLSYDHVFLVNFDDRYLIGDSLDDEKVNKFLVALTRSKKKVSIFSSQGSEPVMVGWIKRSRKKLTS